MKSKSEIYTAKNTVLSPDFLMWKFCGKAQFPHSFEQIARNYAETMPFCKISTPGNQVKLWYFSQCYILHSLKFTSALGNFRGDCQGNPCFLPFHVSK